MQVFRKVSVKKSDLIVGILLVLPIMLWLLIVFIYPILDTLRMSLYNQRLLGMPARFVGLDLYKKALANEEFWIATKNSAIFTFFSVFFQALIGLMVATVLNRDFFGKNFLRTWVILPWIVPYSVIAVIGRWMLSSTFGVVNWALQSTGLISTPINFLGSLEMAMPTVITINVWKWFPFIAVTFLSVMQGISEELYEAARIDGSNRWQEFRYVTIPALTPSIITMALLMTFWNFNTFGLVWLLTAGGPGTATTTLPILAYRTAFRNFRMGEAATLSILMCLILMIFTTAYTKILKNDKEV